MLFSFLLESDIYKLTMVMVTMKRYVGERTFKDSKQITEPDTDKQPGNKHGL